MYRRTLGWRGLIGLLLAIGCLGTVMISQAQEPAGQPPNYVLVNSIFAAGTGGNRMGSANFRMDGTFGEPGLPNTVTISSTNFRHLPGFLPVLNVVRTVSSRTYLAYVQKPPACDSYEPNNALPGFGPLAPNQPYQARLCSGDVDFYYFEVASPQTAQLTLTLPATLVGHASLWLYTATNEAICGTGPIVVASYTTSCTLDAPGRYVVRVGSDATFDPVNSYTLRAIYQ